MYEVNRSVAVIRPREPFLQWLKSLPGTQEQELTLETLRQSSNALLIPPADDADTLADFLRAHVESIFQAELADWCDDEQLWPHPLSAELFAQWFEIDIHGILTDMVDSPLEREAFVALKMDLH
jgi:hypothetical protein